MDDKFILTNILYCFDHVVFKVQYLWLGNDFYILLLKMLCCVCSRNFSDDSFNPF